MHITGENTANSVFKHNTGANTVSNNDWVHLWCSVHITGENTVNSGILSLILVQTR